MNEIEATEPSDTPPVIDHAPLPPPIKALPPSRRRGSGGAMLFSLVLFAALGAGGYYAWTHPNPDMVARIEEASRQARDAASQAAQTAQQLASLTQLGQSLSDRVDKLEKAPPPATAPAPPADLGDLPKRLDDLTARVDALANRPAPSRSDAQAPDASVTQQALADLNQRVGQAFDSQKLAVEQLGTRLDQLGPRINALEQVAGKAKGSEAEAARVARVEAALVALQADQPLGDIPGAPDALTRFATVAPPSEAKLRQDFPALAEHARRVSQPDLAGRSFWQRALTRLQSAVTVRQGSDVLVGDPASGILDDAGVKVQTGDLAGAVTVLKQLRGPAAAAMQGWVDNASALVAARAALAELAARG